jgi:hypothetical protein
LEQAVLDNLEQPDKELQVQTLFLQLLPHVVVVAAKVLILLVYREVAEAVVVRILAQAVARQIQLARQLSQVSHSLQIVQITAMPESLVVITVRLAVAVAAARVVPEDQQPEIQVASVVLEFQIASRVLL